MFSSAPAADNLHRLPPSCLPYCLETAHLWPNATVTLVDELVEVCRSTTYPRIYPTRTVPEDMGRLRVDVLRVGSGTGTKSTGRVYPFFTRKERHFSRCSSYRMFLFFLFSERRRPSVCLSSVCLSSVTFVPLLRGLKFSAMFLRHLMAIPWHPGKILQRSSQGNLSVGGVKTKGVAK